MKRSRAIVMLVLALMAGVAAVFLAGRWLTQQAAAAAQPVAVASRDIELGQPLSANLLELVAWPATAVPKGAFADLATLEGRVVIAAVQRGEPILQSRLAAQGTQGGLSAVIPGGKRAITVKVNEVVGVAGFALPGNFVDVMVNTQDDAQRPISRIVLERILVLAVAQEAGRDETRPKVVSAVTLEVTPQQAERLDLARSVGNLSLVLRNQVDRDSPATTGMRKEDLLGPIAGVAKAASPAPAPPVAQGGARAAVRVVSTRSAGAAAVPVKEPPSVEVIRGVQRSVAQP